MLPIARFVVTALVIVFVSLVTSAQTSWPPLDDMDPQSTTGFFVAWVDPVAGVDTAQPEDQINDSDQPFKTLQMAIDTMQTVLWQEYDGLSEEYPDSFVEGLVYALPGLYGPHGPNSSGDYLPITMRERVHVRGLGTRPVILRGVGDPNTNGLFWPISQPSSHLSTNDFEVLLDLSDIHSCEPKSGGVQPPPWCVSGNHKDTIEVFQGFTFQGGDVQVRMGTSSSIITQLSEKSAIISNCVFDMRHGWIDPVSSNTVAGPYIGVMMSKLFQVSFNGTQGYLDQKILIANNTFIMGRWGVVSGGGQGWVDACRNEAVGILDACNPNCGSSLIDCNATVRGLGSPGIINNVFRTRPFPTPNPTVFPVAMLGIDVKDTRVSESSSLIQTNVFASSLAGQAGTNGYFYSTPVVPVVVNPGNPNGEDNFLHCQNPAPGYYGHISGLQQCSTPATWCLPNSCVSAQVPASAIELYNGPVQSGSPGKDPGFIGEYLSVNISGLGGYIDWRLLPGSGTTGSPLKDVGYFPPEDPLEEGFLEVVMENGTVFEMPIRTAVSPFRWDGEGFGNPRIVDGSPDVGFDEVHLISMAGSYGNYSNSHNASGSLNPIAPTGKPDRYVFVRRSAGGVDLVQGNQIKVHGIQENPPAVVTGQPRPAWTKPPGVLSPSLVNTNLPADYDVKYISFNNQSTPTPPTPFTENLTVGSFVVGWQPLGGATNSFDFVLMIPPNSFSQSLTDNEGSEHTYFNTQAVIYASPSGTVLLRSNLQAEYR